MKRTATTSRLYSLGDFKNISFTDTVEEIPEEFAMNNKAMRILRSMQLFQIERAYLKYIKLKQTMQDMTVDESLELIDELDVVSTEKFNSLFTDRLPVAEKVIEEQGEN